MCAVTSRNQNQVHRELDAVERALMTSFGSETVMLIAQAQDLRGLLNTETMDDEDGEDRRPASAA